MLRITEHLEDGTAVRLRLDGTISQEAFHEVAELCARHQTTDRAVIVDMAGVNFMSHETARKLARMRTESLRIINCSPFIATLLDTAKNSD
jgi:anti-anti-sigma regulatory factor